MLRSLVGSEMCIRDRLHSVFGVWGGRPKDQTAVSCVSVASTWQDSTQKTDNTTQNHRKKHTHTKQNKRQRQMLRKKERRHQKTNKDKHKMHNYPPMRIFGPTSSRSNNTRTEEEKSALVRTGFTYAGTFYCTWHWVLYLRIYESIIIRKHGGAMVMAKRM